jgi:hypothetical protein
MSTETTTPAVILSDEVLQLAREIVLEYVMEGTGLITTGGEDAPIRQILDHWEDTHDATVLYYEKLGPRHPWQGMEPGRIFDLNRMAKDAAEMHEALIEGNTRDGTPLTDPENVEHDRWHAERADAAQRLRDYLQPMVDEMVSS